MQWRLAEEDGSTPAVQSTSNVSLKWKYVSVPLTAACMVAGGCESQIACAESASDEKYAAGDDKV